MKPTPWILMSILFAGSSLQAEVKESPKVLAVLAATYSDLIQQNASLKKANEALEERVKILEAEAKRIDILEQKLTQLAESSESAHQKATQAQLSADAASARAQNPVIMLGHENGRPWAECPAAYHWIGGLNFGTNMIDVAFYEVNRWHKNFFWFCAKN